MKSVAEIIKNMTDWQPPVIPEDIAHGDMPGDKVEIGEEHVKKANVIFKKLLPMLAETSKKSETEKWFLQSAEVPASVNQRLLLCCRSI